MDYTGKIVTMEKGETKVVGVCTSQSETKICIVPLTGALWHSYANARLNAWKIVSVKDDPAAVREARQRLLDYLLTADAGQQPKAQAANVLLNYQRVCKVLPTYVERAFETCFNPVIGGTMDYTGKMVVIQRGGTQVTGVCTAHVGNMISVFPKHGAVWCRSYAHVKLGPDDWRVTSWMDDPIAVRDICGSLASYLMRVDSGLEPKCYADKVLLNYERVAAIKDMLDAHGDLAKRFPRQLDSITVDFTMPDFKADFAAIEIALAANADRMKAKNVVFTEIYGGKHVGSDYVGKLLFLEWKDMPLGAEYFVVEGSDKVIYAVETDDVESACTVQQIELADVNVLRQYADNVFARRLVARLRDFARTTYEEVGKGIERAEHKYDPMDQDAANTIARQIERVVDRVDAAACRLEKELNFAKHYGGSAHSFAKARQPGFNWHGTTTGRFQSKVPNCCAKPVTCSDHSARRCNDPLDFLAALCGV